jgi:hypothetical protein
MKKEMIELSDIDNILKELEALKYYYQNRDDFEGFDWKTVQGIKLSIEIVKKYQKIDEKEEE